MSSADLPRLHSLRRRVALAIMLLLIKLPLNYRGEQRYINQLFAFSFALKIDLPLPPEITDSI